jgi:hypothetical protein
MILFFVHLTFCVFSPEKLNFVLFFSCTKQKTTYFRKKEKRFCFFPLFFLFFSVYYGPEARIIQKKKRKVILEEKWIFWQKEKSHIIREKVILKKSFCPKSGFHHKKWLFFRIIWGGKPFFGKMAFFDQKK